MLGSGQAKVSSEVLRQVEQTDLIQYGLIPEFVGRFPIISSLQVPVQAPAEQGHMCPASAPAMSSHEECMLTRSMPCGIRPPLLTRIDLCAHLQAVTL